MTSNTDLTELIEKELEKFPFKGEPRELYEPLNYIISIGGKRLRPQLLLLSCQLFGGRPEKALKPALGLEVFHNFTLMHDDIMDRAPLRRGKETVHTRWSEPTAILSGDVMLVKAYELMMQVEDPILRDVLELFSQTASAVCEGQQMDMNFELRDDVGVDEYIQMITLKTAVLLGCALKMGGIVAGADTEQADLMYDYGIHLGIAFQLIDDVLDVYGEPEKVGKRKGGDILSDKKTFLLLKALEVAQPEERKELKKWIGKKDADPAQKIAAVTRIFDDLGVKQMAIEKSDMYFKKAGKLFDAVHVEKELKSTLTEFAEKLKTRIS